MSRSSRPVTVTVPLRKLCAALPAVVLMAAGISLSAPGHSIKSAAVSSDSPGIVVPDTALSLPAPVATPTDNLPLTLAQAQAPTPKAAGAVGLMGAVLGRSSVVTLDSTGIPVRALEGYRRAASLVSVADPACHVDWALLGAIGRVESNHARFGGNHLDAAGVAQPGIIGIALDGSNGTARITDTEDGLLDRDSVFDRAVGPMQFIPSTWRVVGVDADGDGVKNPQDMADAATATAIYLCSGPGDLTRPGDLSAAIWRYNASDSYVALVTAIADAYRHGVRALPASDLDPVNATLAATAAGPFGSTAGLGQTPAASPGAPSVIPPTAAPAPSTPGTPDPTMTVPITTVPDPTTTVPDPTTTVPPTTVTDPTTTVPTTTATVPTSTVTDPTTTVPTTTVTDPTTTVPTTTVP